MLKGSYLDRVCMYDRFSMWEDYTIQELVLYITMSIMCMFGFDEKLLDDPSVKRLKHSMCAVLGVDNHDIVNVYGLLSRCVEFSFCFGFYVQVFREVVAGAPVRSVCWVVADS